ncbi:MAG: sugar phosphate nucleotidyltransferase [Patescibacteria group bacterium]
MEKKIKGVILAGGSGTRLFPNTKVTNKHLLPVYNQPMIYYAIQTLMKAGINEILILPGKDHAGDFAKLLGSGKDFNANFQFKVQDHAGGLAYAVRLAKEFVGNDNFVVIFGDNIIEDNITKDVQGFRQGAVNFLKQVPDPKRFGIAELDDNKIINIEEKPQEPKSNWAVIGLYIYDSKVFEYIETLKPSIRGELEITDLNNIYIKKGDMKAAFIKGYWFDTGTHESLIDAAYALKNFKKPLEFLKLEANYSPKVLIGGIVYDSEDKKYTTSKYLPDFINSVKTQDYQNMRLVFVDNSPSQDNDNSRYLKNNYPLAKIIWKGENIGYAKANNLMIKEALAIKADYFLASNVDMIYEPNVVSELVNAVMKTPQVGFALCKIKKWDFNNRKNIVNGKTNFIDTVGIEIIKGHRFVDKGQGEIDHGQYDMEEEVFGASGAAVIYKLSALDDVAFIRDDCEKEYFDELMFMYKEDVDLSYRLQLAGYKCVYTPKTTIYHDRTVQSEGRSIYDIIKGRLGRKKEYKEWSWLNHHIILQKMLDNSCSSKTFWQTIWYEIKSNLYILLFEPHVIKQWKHLFKIRKEIKARRDQVKRRIDFKNIEKLMKN